MTSLRMINAQTSLDKHRLRLFFRQNRISLEVMKAVYVSINKKLWRGIRVHCDDLTMLQDLPTTLKQKLFSEVYLPPLADHPFLGVLAEVDKQFAIALCNSAIEEAAIDQNSRFFGKHESVSGLHFILSGVMTYTRLGRRVPLSKQQWICEPALWILDWRSRGDLVAARRSELLTLRADSFRELLGAAELGSNLRIFTCQYAVTFLRWEGCTVEGLHYSDLWFAQAGAEAMLEQVMHFCDVQILEVGCADNAMRLKRLLPSVYGSRRWN